MTTSSVRAAKARELWLRALAEGNRGWLPASAAQLGRARALLLVGGVDRHALALSRLLSAEASFRRQAGDHGGALPLNGRAWHLAVLAARQSGAEASPGGWSSWGTPADAASDAAVGLAADYLGVGNLAAARRALGRAARAHEGQSEAADVPSLEGMEGMDNTGDDALPWLTGRLRRDLRLAWVTTELEIASGRVAKAPLGRATLAAWHAVPSARHRLKTRLIAAAVDFMRAEAGGGPGGSAEVGREALSIAGACVTADLLPLAWAAYSLAAAAGESTAVEPLSRTRAALHLRGMYIRDVLGGSGL